MTAQDAAADPKPALQDAGQDEVAVTDDQREAMGLIEAIETLWTQLRSGVDAGAQLGRIEFALFRVGLVRIAALSVLGLVLLVSLWFLLLAGLWVGLVAVSGSQLVAFASTTAIVAVAALITGLRIRRWLSLSFFPRLRRQFDATLQQWKKPL